MSQFFEQSEAFCGQRISSSPRKLKEKRKKTNLGLRRNMAGLQGGFQPHSENKFTRKAPRKLTYVFMISFLVGQRGLRALPGGAFGSTSEGPLAQTENKFPKKAKRKTSISAIPISHFSFSRGGPLRGATLPEGSEGTTLVPPSAPPPGVPPVPSPGRKFTRVPTLQKKINKFLGGLRPLLP